MTGQTICMKPAATRSKTERRPRARSVQPVDRAEEQPHRRGALLEVQSRQARASRRRARCAWHPQAAVQGQPVDARRAGARGRAAPGVGSDDRAGVAERRRAEAAGLARPDEQRPGSGDPHHRADAEFAVELAQGEGSRAVRAQPGGLGTRARDHGQPRQGRLEPRPAAPGDPLSRHHGRIRQPPDSRRRVSLVERSQRQEADHQQLHDRGRSRAPARPRQGRNRRRTARRRRSSLA